MNKNEKKYEREEREGTGDNTRAGADGFVWYKFKVINRFESHPFSALYTLWDWINLAQNITHFWMFTLFVNSRLIALLKFFGGEVYLKQIASYVFTNLNLESGLHSCCLQHVDREDTARAPLIMSVTMVIWSRAVLSIHHPLSALIIIHIISLSLSRCPHSHF